MLSERFVALMRRQARLNELLALIEAHPRSTAELAGLTGRTRREIAGVLGWLAALDVVQARTHVSRPAAVAAPATPRRAGTARRSRRATHE